MKKFKIMLLFLFAVSIPNYAANSNIEFLKERYKFNTVSTIKNIVDNANTVFLGNRIESDAILELADGGYDNYLAFNIKENISIPQSFEMLLMMPRIDLLEKNIDKLAKTTKNVYVFLLSGDKAVGDYGDRSYETYMAKNLEARLPKNVKVFKLQTKIDQKYFDITEKVPDNVYKEIKELHSTVSHIKL